MSANPENMGGLSPAEVMLLPTSTVRRITSSANDPDPSDSDILAAMGGLGRNDRCYIELGTGKGSIAVYYEANYEHEEQDAGGREHTVSGAWVMHDDTMRNRKPFPTMIEALTAALKKLEALL
jgi:hypothetical protein